MADRHSTLSRSRRQVAHIDRRRHKPGLGEKSPGTLLPEWGQIMVVDVTTQPAFSAGTPRLLFEEGRSPDWEIAEYDVAPDDRFLMVMSSGQESKATAFNVIQNWFEDLKTRVPAR